MSRRLKIIKYYIIILIIIVGNTLAQDIVEIHGLVSQSVIFSTHNSYLFDGTQDGSLEYTEALLNFNKQFEVVFNYL